MSGDLVIRCLELLCAWSLLLQTMEHGRIVGSRITGSINRGGARPTQHRAWVMHCQLSFTEVSGRHAVFCFMGRHVRQQIDEP
jgi:hypothetical protein